MLVQTSQLLVGFPQHPGVSVVESQQAWYFQISTSSTVIFRLLHQLSPLCSWWRSGRCGLSPSGCDQLPLNCFYDVQLQRTCLVRCPLHKTSQATHQRKDSICTCTDDAMHFTTNWLVGVGSLCHVHVHRDVLTDIDWTFYWSLLTCIDRPIRFDTSQLKSYQVPKHENYTSNNDSHIGR